MCMWASGWGGLGSTLCPAGDTWEAPRCRNSVEKQTPEVRQLHAVAMGGARGVQGSRVCFRKSENTLSILELTSVPTLISWCGGQGHAS